MLVFTGTINCQRSLHRGAECTTEALVYEHERLLTGGIWANIELSYDETRVHKGVTRPFVLNRLQPIQIASASLPEFIEGRAKFTRDEWADILLRTLGYEPTNGDFTPRRKLLFLTRLIPMVEKNYNLIELGPRGTGKSYVYREISPYVILLSGGQGSVADLFGWKNRRDKPGLVIRYDLVAFDEVAGPNSLTQTCTMSIPGPAKPVIRRMYPKSGNTCNKKNNIRDSFFQC